MFAVLIGSCSYAASFGPCCCCDPHPGGGEEGEAGRKRMSSSRKSRRGAGAEWEGRRRGADGGAEAVSQQIRALPLKDVLSQVSFPLFGGVTLCVKSLQEYPCIVRCHSKKGVIMLNPCVYSHVDFLGARIHDIVLRLPSTVRCCQSTIASEKDRRPLLPVDRRH